MSEAQDTKSAAEPDAFTSSPSSSESHAAHGDGDDGGGGGGGGGGGCGAVLYGLTTVQKAFHFLPDPADVLRAATACRRWRELACADSVWRARFEREGLVDTARAFEVALPAAVQGGAGGGVGGGGGGDDGSSSSAAAESEDELAGVGLAFYAQVFALKVRRASLGRHLTELVGGGCWLLACPSHHRSHPPRPPLCRGIR